MWSGPFQLHACTKTSTHQVKPQGKSAPCVQLSQKNSHHSLWWQSFIQSSVPSVTSSSLASPNLSHFHTLTMTHMHRATLRTLTEEFSLGLPLTNLKTKSGSNAQTHMLVVPDSPHYAPTLHPYRLHCGHLLFCLYLMHTAFLAGFPLSQSNSGVWWLVHLSLCEQLPNLCSMFDTLCDESCSVSNWETVSESSRKI